MWYVDKKKVFDFKSYDVIYMKHRKLFCLFLLDKDAEECNKKLDYWWHILTHGKSLLLWKELSRELVTAFPAGLCFIQSLYWTCWPLCDEDVPHAFHLPIGCLITRRWWRVECFSSICYFCGGICGGQTAVHHANQWTLLISGHSLQEAPHLGKITLRMHSLPLVMLSLFEET